MAPLSVPGAAKPRPAAPRPNPTRLRFALGTGGVAALSALLTAIAVPPSSASPSSPVALPDPLTSRLVRDGTTRS